MVVKHRVCSRVKPRCSHLLGNRHADGVRHALTQRTSGAFHTQCFKILGMSGSVRTQSAKGFHLINADLRIAGQMQPAVKEHGAMTCGEDKAVTVQPAGFCGVIAERVSKQDSTNFSATQGKSEMSRGTGVNGIHGEAAGFSCGALQVGEWEIHKQ